MNPTRPRTRTPHARPPRGAAGARPRTGNATLLRWPIGLVAVLLALGAWRGGDAPPRARQETRPALVERSFQDARIPVPRSWGTLDRSAEHVTWGDAGRHHTVTLAATEASVLPLPGVVDALVRDAVRELPGAELLGRPRPLELEPRAARGDAAMLARFRVRVESGPPLQVVQVWRRDARSGQDLVATWTSTDGHWPAAPRQSIPRAPASR